MSRRVVLSNLDGDSGDVALHAWDGPEAEVVWQAWEAGELLRHSHGPLEYPEAPAGMSLRAYTDPFDGSQRFGVVYLSEGSGFLDDFASYAEAEEGYLVLVVMNWPFHYSDVVDEAEHVAARARYDARAVEDAWTEKSLPWSEKDAPWARYVRDEAPERSGECFCGRV